MMMDLEEDGPPDLVDLSSRTEPVSSSMTLQMQDLTISKVPLTIITGKACPIQTDRSSCCGDSAEGYT